MTNEKKKQAKGQGGFTLIEIIAVLIILGILAAVATPKFMSMQKEARIATLKGGKAAMQSAAVMVYAKASLVGKSNELTTTEAPDLKGTVTLENGYPNNLASLLNAMDYDGFQVTGETLHIPGYAGCKITYGPAVDGGMPTFEISGAGKIVIDGVEKDTGTGC